MRYPEPRKTEVHGNVRWLVRVPKAMGGGREYFPTEAKAVKKIEELKRTEDTVSREFARLPRQSQIAILNLLGEFGGDAAKLVEAATKGRSKVKTPKLIGEAVAEFKTDHKASEARMRDVRFCLAILEEGFKGQTVDSIESFELLRLLNSKDWGPKMFNGCRQAWSQFWKYCILRKPPWADSNPLMNIKPKRLPRHLVAIYAPEEIHTILARLAIKKPALIPFVAVAAFTGMRTSEIARLSCEKLHGALKAGHLELTAEEAGKTSIARVVPILPPLRTWLAKHLPATGPVIPAKWSNGKNGRLHELVKAVARRSKVPSKSNGFRHSYATYRFKLTNDVGQTVDELGTSIAKFERHYRRRGSTVTTESANLYFSPGEGC